MKIFFHIGYHKTGSSFLQMMFSLNREYLSKNNFYYPLSVTDADSKSGKISPGNGLELALALRKNENDFSSALKIIENWIREAERNKCDNLIISSEGLFHSFSQIKYRSFFEKINAEFDLDGEKILLFLRDPLDHIFSLYKHRGKRGTIPDFKNWVENEYETLQLTKQFFEGMMLDPKISFSFRKYKNDSQFLSDAVFRDWLKISTPDIPKKDRVNDSLSLSEIMVLENVFSCLGQEKTVKIQKRLLKNSKFKPKDENLKNHYALQLGPFLEKHQPLIEKININMPEDERLVVEIINLPQDDFKFVVLTEEQLKIIIEESSITMGLKDKMVENVKEFYRKFRKNRVIY